METLGDFLRTRMGNHKRIIRDDFSQDFLLMAAGVNISLQQLRNKYRGLAVDLFFSS